MNIFITGGTGFIGSNLVSTLIEKGHQVCVLTRQKHLQTKTTSGQIPLTFCNNLNEFENFDAFDVVINLAGEPIFDKWWTAKQKQTLTNSRVQLTQQLVDLINNSTYPPHTFISGSATGYYGDLAKTTNDLTAYEGKGFTSELCQQWETTALQAQTRVCVIRTGLVLSPKGGMIKQLLPMYKWGLGGKLGSGKQHWAWISLEDHIQATLFLIENKQCKGTFNFVAPELITQAEFNRQFAKAVHRPAFFNAPAFILKLVLGERSQLLLDNQPLVPQKLLDYGFKFENRCLKNYLNLIIGRNAKK